MDPSRIAKQERATPILEKLRDVVAAADTDYQDVRFNRATCGVEVWRVGGATDATAAAMYTALATATCR